MSAVRANPVGFRAFSFNRISTDWLRLASVRSNTTNSKGGIVEFIEPVVFAGGLSQRRELKTRRGSSRTNRREIADLPP